MKLPVWGAHAECESFNTVPPDTVRLIELPTTNTETSDASD